MPHKRAKRSVREAETAKKGSNLPPSTKALTSAYDDTPKSASRIISGWKFQSEFRSSGKTNSEDTGQPKSASSDPSASSSSNTKSNNVDKGKGKGKEEIPKILPNETLGEYNRRIETLLRGGVSKAIKDAASIKAAEAAQANRDKKVRKRKAKLEKLIKDGKVPKEALEKYLKEVREKELTREKGKRKRDVEDDEEEGEGEGEEKEKKRPIKEFREMERPRRLNDIVQAPPQLPHLRKSGQSKGTGKEVYSAIGRDSGKIPLNAGQKRILEEERERVVRMYREMKARKEEDKGKKV
ncbi:hypothetical protein I302_101853 [Kwoniella bestiolae CBS 10118]|uniref:Uncharacterized protein n=1 Tax=Kwoniella bestiolae CBS 10118 TaxID=1296100 RepID=A0A1B9GDE8_9TREE|nr:hypothetical protein I302_00532 [Kwoniella bestiolae CBS 10118]OCF29041.1 hypothetical protein I302_00532 [Kwoniella bestiolae CBS 10118]